MKRVVKVFEIDEKCRECIDKGRRNLVQAYLLERGYHLPPDIYWMVEDASPYRTDIGGMIYR